MAFTGPALSRRSLVATMGSLAVAGCARPAKSANEIEIVVAGAGLAGLTAAYELRRAGVKVRVIEQAAIAGGRVRTERDVFSDGDVVELGGTEVASSYVNFLAYCDEFNVAYAVENRPRVARDILLDEGNTLYSLNALRNSDNWPIAFNTEERARIPFGLLGSYVTRVAREIGSIDRLLLPEFAHLDAMSLRQLLQQQGATEAAIAFIDRTLNYNSVDTVSALSVLRDQLRRLGAGRPESIKLKKGNASLPKAFASRLGNTVSYRSSLKAIHNEPGEVSVRVALPGGEENWRCDALVVALPFTALRDVQIEGLMPKHRQKMINELPYTQISRTYLKTQSRFWEQDGPVAAIYSDGPLERFFDISDYEKSDAGLLMNWVNGIGNAVFSGDKHDQRVERIVRGLGERWPGAATQVEKAVSVDWADTYCKGAYAHFAPGQVGEFAATMAKPLGRLHFAGEHTEFEGAGLEGAIVSGRRAAQAVLDSV